VKLASMAYLIGQAFGLVFLSFLFVGYDTIYGPKGFAHM